MGKLIAKLTIFEKGEKDYKRTILSEKTEEYEVKNWDGNCQKGDFIFNALQEYETYNDRETETSKYYLSKVNAISINFGMLQYNDTYYPHEHQIDRNGYEVFNTHIDSIVILECYTFDNKILRFDFQGHTDANDDLGYFTYFDYSIRSWDRYRNDKEIKAQETFDELTTIYDYDHTYTNNQFPVEAHKHIIKSHYGMIEIFSDLVEPEKYQSDFGVNTLYCKRCLQVYNDMVALSHTIKNSYDNVETFVSDWNDGCENGCALYIYIL